MAGLGSAYNIIPFLPLILTLRTRDKNLIIPNPRLRPQIKFSHLVAKSNPEKRFPRKSSYRKTYPLPCQPEGVYIELD